MFFNGWDELGRVIVVGVLTYAALVLMLRLTGNRTLSKMNSFDLVVTVAFGSTLSSILIDDSITLAEGITAIALLIGLQFIVTWLSVRSKTISRLVKTEPTLILRDGEFLRDAMKKTRVTENEIRSAIRKHGYGGAEMIHSVVMETDGSLSVVANASAGSSSALQGIQGARAQ